MGSTNLTPNYELSQFIGTDKPAWLQDYNGDMLKIDTGIAGAKTAADNAQSAADGAQGDATTALNSIADINTELGTVENTLSTATGNINTINSLIGNGTPTTTDQTIIGAINELHSDQGNLTTLETTNKNSLVGAINELNEKGWNFAVVNVTSDGVKTLSQLLDEAHAAIVSKYEELGANYYYPIGVFGSAIGITANAIGWFVRNAINSPIIFAIDYIDESNPSLGVIHHQYNLKTSGSKGYSGNSSTGTYNDISSTVPTSGQTVGAEFMYRLN